MSWIAVAIGGATALAGGIQANQVRQQKKGSIGAAYRLGQERLNLQQLDTRQSVAESAGSRGLTAGGDVTADSSFIRTAVARDPAERIRDSNAPHTLGAQQGADLAKEQDLERRSLAEQKAAADAGVDAEATQSMVNAVTTGINTGFSAHGALSDLGAMGKMPGTAAPSGTAMAGSSMDPYPGAFGGIDPVKPFARGTWSPAGGSTGGAKKATTVADFNVFG